VMESSTVIVGRESVDNNDDHVDHINNENPRGKIPNLNKNTNQPLSWRSVATTALVMVVVLSCCAGMARNGSMRNAPPFVGLDGSTFYPPPMDLPLMTTTMTTLDISPIPDTNASASAQRELSATCLRDSSTVGDCRIQGQIDYVAATKVYQSFCPAWNPNLGQSFATHIVCTTYYGQRAGYDAIFLRCNGKTSAVFNQLPVLTPTIGGGAVTFPVAGQGYVARQAFLTSSGGTCIQDYTLGMYCPISSAPCFVFAAWANSTCGQPVQVCG
jgi:hypothetical protein